MGDQAELQRTYDFFNSPRTAIVSSFPHERSSLSDLVQIAQNNVPTKQVATVDEITQEEITRYMSMNTVEEILGDSVKYIKPSEWDGAISGSKKDGVLVFVYSTKGDANISKREAIIFKNLIFNYLSKIDFLVCKGNDELTTHGLTAAPSIAMYSKYDVLKGESINNSDKQMKQVDILRGGPSMDKDLNPFYRNIKNYWITGNVTLAPNPDNDNKLYRYQNSGNLQEVGQTARNSSR